MSKRNFILLVIVLIIVIAGVLGYMYVNRTPAAPTDTGGGTNFFSQFNPFGASKPNTNNGNTPVDVSNNGTTGDEIPVTPSKLTKISSMPIAGYSLYPKERYKIGATTTETVPAIRYVDRAVGYIYETFADNIKEERFSNTLIPKIYEASFGSKAESVIMRYLKSDDSTIATFSGSLSKELLGSTATGDKEISGTFLPDNITDMSVSPDGLKVFYLTVNGEIATGTTAGILGDKKVQVFSSPFTEWLSSWPAANMITLTTKPSATVPGYMYAINPSTKSFDRVLGEINGLTTLTSPSGKLVLYADSSLSLSIYHTDTRTSDPIGLKTLPDKCVWGQSSATVYCAVPRTIPAASYPDDWYRGEVSFSDQIWNIDAATDATSLIVDPAAEREDVDAIKLSVDSNNTYLLFVNKKDSFLWKYDLK